MYKLLVVEDEDAIRMGIINAINWNELGFKVCGQAANGKDALKKIQENRPDVVLTDLKMPIMGGIEFSKTLKRIYPEIEIIVLSGYADFNYAQEAIRFQAYEYLLKPTNKKKFIETFKRLKKDLDNNNKMKKDMIDSYQKYNKALIKLRNDFIGSLLNGSITSLYTLEDNLNYVELDLSGKYFVVASMFIDGPEKEILDEWKNEKQLISYAYANIVNEIIQELGKGFAVSYEYNEIIVIYCSDKNTILKENLINILDKSRYHLENNIFNNIDVKIFAGIGKVYSDILQVHKSFLQSQKALDKRFFTDDVYTFTFEKDDYLDIKNEWLKNYPSEANNIINEAMSGNTNITKDLINKFFYKINKKISTKLIKSYSYVLCFLLKTSINDLKIENSDFLINSQDFDKEINKQPSIDTLKEYIMKLFTDATEKINNIKNENISHHSKIIDEVKKYIDDNYYKNLSLEQISNHVYLSPTYLSFLFKNVTGETYIDYLKKVRMDKAKELLKDINLKVYEIANMVGYNDYKYFSIQFKKMVGSSPSEYRDQI